MDRAFDILELISRERKGLTLTDIGKKVNLPRSTTFRLLASLQNRGYIEKNPKSSIYHLGLEFIELSSSLLNNLELKTEAEPFLRRLSMQTSSTVFLAIRQDLEIVYYDKVEKYDDIRKYCIVGQRRPLYCTSLGKSLLSGLSDREIRKLLKDVEFKPMTPKTITNIDGLLKEVELVRKRGWAFDDEEIITGIRCISAPIYDYRNIVIAGVSTSWEMEVNKDADINQIAQWVMTAASQISKRMGGSRRGQSDRYAELF